MVSVKRFLLIRRERKEIRNQIIPGSREVSSRAYDDWEISVKLFPIPF